MLLKLAIVFCSVLLANDSGSLVDLKKMDFSFLIEMPYASDKNPTGRKWHSEQRCLLRTEAAEALVRAQKAFQLTGNRLKLQECYIPELIGKVLLIQKRNKGVGFDFESQFGQGGSVALTLVDREGKEFKFPGNDYSGKKYPLANAQASSTAEANLKKLQWIMKKEGFLPDPRVPWFYVYQNSRNWPLINIPLKEIP